MERLLTCLRAQGFHATVLYLDKGFCNGEVIRALQQQQQAAVLACPIRGKGSGKGGGLRALCHGRGSRIVPYTFTDGTCVEAVLLDTRVPDHTRKRRRKWLAFVRIGLSWTPTQVYAKYRRRFGIESSYRMLRQTKVRSNARNPALRFFLLALSLVVQNEWVALRWLLLRRQGRGRYKLMRAALTFDRFCKLLLRGIEATFPSLTTVAVFLSPESVIY